MSKIIFLDVDGVLNTFSDGTDALGHIFHKPFVDNLIELVDKTQAKIVVTSSWRYQLKNIFKIRNIPLEILDITPDFSLYEDSNGFRNKRGLEVESWLKGKDITSYIILDDRNDFTPEQQSRLILTSENYFHPDSIDGEGFTKTLLDKALLLLKN